MKKYIFLVLFSTLVFFQLKAHVTITSVHGGKTYKPGDMVTITWVMSVNHDSQNWDLFFSSDGGSSWSVIKNDIPIGTLNYQWTVPDTETTQAILKVVQDNPDENYEDVCEIFAISNTTTGINESFSKTKTSVYPNPLIDYTTFTFNNPYYEHFTLTLYNRQGQLVRTINNITTDKVIIQKGKLKSGMYFFQLIADGQLRATQPLMVK